MSTITTPQIKAVRATLHRFSLLDEKETIIEAFTNGRTTRISEMTMEEARELLLSFNRAPEARNRDDKGPMIRKLFAMAHEMGWIKEVSAVGENGKLETKKDYSSVYNWVTKFGYLGKDLRKYTYKELPKLLSQFEFHIYKPYLEKLSK